MHTVARVDEKVNEVFRARVVERMIRFVSPTTEVHHARYKILHDNGYRRSNRHEVALSAYCSALFNPHRPRCLDSDKFRRAIVDSHPSKRWVRRGVLCDDFCQKKSVEAEKVVATLMATRVGTAVLIILENLW